MIKNIKYVIIIISLFSLCFFNNASKAESISASCGAMVAQAPVWPVQTFKASCTATATGLKPNFTNYSMGIYTFDYITTKMSGNGENITYNSSPPGNRFKVVGPEQAGTPANITTGSAKSSVTIFKTGVLGANSATIPFDLYYTTYEADYGDTVYNQPFVVQLYKNSISVAKFYNPAAPLNFKIVNRNYLAVSAPPTVNLPLGLVLLNNQDQDSNTMTISVYSNNTWHLNTYLAGNLISGSDDIPVTSNYFRATGYGFDNLATAKTQFANAGSSYNIAQNTYGVYTTGIAADSMYLTPINVSVIYNVRTTDLFKSGTYVTKTIFGLISP